MKGAILLGILLLIGSIVGAKYVYEQQVSSANNHESDNQAAYKLPPENVYIWGNFDIEPGVIRMYPVQGGAITYVAKENTEVNANDLLLQVNDSLAQLKLKEAEADVVASVQQLAEANLLTRQYKLQRDQQQAAVNAAGFEIEQKKLERDSKVQLLDEKQPLTLTIKKIYAETLKELGEKLKAEQAKLEQVGLLDASLKIKQAEADLQAKQVRVSQAAEVVKQCKIVAPSKGTVLRVFAHKGEVLGAHPRTEAIDFLPEISKENPMIVRAEVMQEWIRFVKPGQQVEIGDDTYEGPSWKGTVRSMSKWLATTRTPVIEPFRQNDVRSLECIIEVTEGDAPKLIGQRVRAKINVK
jgi:multidrug resistance efflux pump